MGRGGSAGGMNNKGARKSGADAMLLATDGQTPSASSAALRYLPAGTAAGSAIARRPSPRVWARGKLGPIERLIFRSAASIRTSLLPNRLKRVAALMSLRSVT